VPTVWRARGPRVRWDRRRSSRLPGERRRRRRGVGTWVLFYFTRPNWFCAHKFLLRTAHTRSRGRSAAVDRRRRVVNFFYGTYRPKPVRRAGFPEFLTRRRAYMHIPIISPCERNAILIYYTITIIITSTAVYVLIDFGRTENPLYGYYIYYLRIISIKRFIGRRGVERSAWDVRFARNRFRNHHRRRLHGRWIDDGGDTTMAKKKTAAGRLSWI